MTLNELEEIGLKRMSNEEIKGLIDHKGFGVLGINRDNQAPYMLPMSYGYDRDHRLYFSYIISNESSKDRLTEDDTKAGFLVHAVDSRYIWESVYLEGTVREIRDNELEDASDYIDTGWRPDIMKQAGESLEVKVYEFNISEKSGIKHTALPPGFEESQS